MGKWKQDATDSENESMDRKVAKYFGMSQDEYGNYQPTFHERENGMGYYYQFPLNLPEDVSQKVGVGAGGIYDITLAELNDIIQSEDPGIENESDGLQGQPELPGL